MGEGREGGREGGGEERRRGKPAWPTDVFLDCTLVAPTALGARRSNAMAAHPQPLPPSPQPQLRRPEGELRCVLAVIRHGDRTPKQKMKMKVTQEPLLALLHKYMDSKGKQAKLKVRRR